MIDTPWAPHPSHPGRPRLQRPAYEEPIAVGTLPKFIETSTTKPKTVRFETRLSDSAGPSCDSSTSRRGASQKNLHVLHHPHQVLKAHGWTCASHQHGSRHDVCLWLTERTANKNVKRPAEVNIVLTLARVDNGEEVAAWTEEQQAHTWSDTAGATKR